MYLEITLKGDALKGRRTVTKLVEADKPDELWRQAHSFINDHEPEASDIFGRGDVAHEEFENEQAMLRSAGQAPHA